MKAKTLFILLIIAFNHNSFSQAVCDSLKLYRERLKKVTDINYRESNIEKRKISYYYFLALNDSVIQLAKRCFQEQNTETGSLGELKNNYLLGKLLYQCGKCNEAQLVFKSCLENQYCGSTKLKNAGTYAQVIAGAYTSCRPFTQHETSVSSTYYINNYSGKGGAFAQGLFEKIEPSKFNSIPLNADEIESIYERTVWNTTIIDTNLVHKLSGNTKFILKPPFLFMQGNEGYSYIPLKQQKNLGGEAGGSKSLKLQDFSNFVFKRYKDLSETFFDRYNTKDRLISFYIIGSDYSVNGLNGFLTFCDSIHFRAHEMVAYYMPLDNSVVVWGASGGGTLIHEMIHSIMAGDFPNAPMWLNEGIASLYEETNENGIPADNYRLIYIQKSGVFIKISDLLDAEKYHDLNDINYNLLNAYSRYLCKYIYDKYGRITLIAVYKGIRDLKDKTVSNQMTVLSSILKKSESEIQIEWQLYVTSLSTPKRYKGLVPEISRKFYDFQNYIFEKSEISTH